uniref:Titin n=1 Tax=Ciona savignyi TaxID=51511 RepID=H2YLF8_CIOSA
RPPQKEEKKLDVDDILDLLKEVDPKEYEKYARHYGITDYRQLLSRYEELRSKEPKKSISFIKPLDEIVTVKEGESLTLICHVSRERARVQWFRNGVQLKPGPRYKTSISGFARRLTINDNVTLADTSAYSCKVANVLSTAQVFVEERRNIKIRRDLRDVEATEGQSVTFECEISHDDVKVRWYLNGEHIKECEGFRFENVGRKHRMIIDNVSAASAGSIKFVASKASTEAELTVMEPLVEFVTPIHDLVVEEKAKAVFECEISDPDVKVRWYKNGLPITNSDRVTIEANRKIHSVSLPWTLCSDTGSYQVVAEFAKSDAKLTVEGKTISFVVIFIDAFTTFSEMPAYDIADDKREIVVVEPEPIRISVPISGLPAPTITWVRNRDGQVFPASVPSDGTLARDPIKPPSKPGKPNVMEDKARSSTLTASDGITKYSVPGAKRSDKGTYLITAENDQGKATASVVVNVLDVPSPSPGQPQVTGVSRDAMTVFWEVPENDGGAVISKYILEKRSRTKKKWSKATSDEIGGNQYRVRGLREGQEYMFRVAAVNAAGQSEFSAPSDLILASAVVSPPGPPFPSVKDITKSAVSLAWKVPDTDGGSKIKGYHVEMQEGDSEEWIKATKHDQRSCEFVVPDLPQGKKYNFRVMALNAAGQGEPGYIAEPVIIQEKQEMPEISLNVSVKEKIVVKAGGVINIPLYVTGRPSPTVSWEKDNKELPEEARIKTTPTTSALEVHKGERKDSGLYKVTVQNDGGQRDGKIILAVVNKPTPPRDLDVKEVTHEHVLLTWEAPEDDGGSELLNYVIEKRDISRMMWTTVNSTSLKTEFRISKLSEGSEYVFRVMAENNQGCSNPAETQGVVVKDRYRTVVVKEKQEAPEIEIQASMSREQIIKSGLPMSLSAIVRGNPFPTITWNKNDEAIATTNERFKRSVKHGIVKIETDASSRNDSGRYSLTAENGAGKKTVSVIVNVL